MRERDRGVRHDWALGILAFCLVTICIFSPALFGGKSLFAGDAPGLCRKEFVLSDVLSHYVGNWGWGNSSLGDGYGATALNPLRLERDLVTFSGKHLSVTYATCCLLVFLGAIYYLRGLGVATKRAFAPGIAIAFAGYSFTLIKAGHIGFFQMMAYAVFVFGFLHRAVTQRSFLHYALAGTFVVWAIAVQPDMMMPITILLGAYGLLLCCLEWRGITREKRRAFIIRTAIGIAVASVFFGVFGIGTFGFISETIAPQRIGEAGKTPQERWIFATNWSLPVDEAAELICPNIFGIDSENRDVPYWGKLGRPYQWEQAIESVRARYLRAQTDEQKRAIAQQYARYLGSRNFRQHTVYQGVLQVVLACLALLLAIFGPKGRPTDPSDEECVHSLRPYIFFWSTIAVLSLLFAFGRYAPFYRLAYAMPLLKNMRAPVKYLRIVEIALAFLLGLGMEQAWRCRSREESTTAYPVGRRLPYGVLAIVCGLSCMIFILALIDVSGMPATLKQRWIDLGVDGQSDALLRQMLASLTHSAVLFGIAAVVMILAVRKKTGAMVLKWLPWAALVIVSIDVAVVGRDFIFVKDKSSFYAPNPIADIITQNDSFKRTDNMFLPYNKLNPISHNWVHHGVLALRPSTTRLLKKDMADYFDALAGHDQRLWLLTSTGFVMLPRERLAPYDGSLAEVTGFTVEDERYVKLATGKGPLVLCTVQDSLPYTAVYHSWRTEPHAAVLSQLKSTDWSPRECVLLEQGDDTPGGPGTEGTSPATVSFRGNTKTEITTELDREGILLVNESFHPDVVVKVDGKTRPLLRCNGMMRGVFLNPGTHNIVFTYRPYAIPLALNIAATLGLLGWVGGSAVARRRKRVVATDAKESE